MHIVIEQWKYKQTWLNLSLVDRQVFVSNIGAAVEELAKQGITTLGFGFNNAETDRRADFDFFAVWQCTTQQGANAFLAAVKGSGWYDFFEHQNMSGEIVDPSEVLTAHCLV
jgi:hypothetical protein